MRRAATRCGARRLATPFDIRLRKLGRAGCKQEGLERQDRTGLLAGGDDEWCLVFVGREDVAQGVADTHCGMKVHHGGVTGRLRVAVGHADYDRFLQAQHVAEIGWEVAEQREFRRAGVAEDGGHAELA